MKFVLRRHGGVEHVYYWCSGCKNAHSVPAERWHWNRSIESPTLSPSVRHFVPAFDGHPERTTCHYHINNGVIEYCSDCPHPMNGQKEPLQEIPDDYHIPEDDSQRGNP